MVLGLSLRFAIEAQSEPGLFWLACLQSLLDDASDFGQAFFAGPFCDLTLKFIPGALFALAVRILVLFQVVDEEAVFHWVALLLAVHSDEQVRRKPCDVSLEFLHLGLLPALASHEFRFGGHAVLQLLIQSRGVVDFEPEFERFELLQSVALLALGDIS